VPVARLFELLPLVCSNCAADKRINAFVIDAAPIERILGNIRKVPWPPRPLNLRQRKDKRNGLGTRAFNVRFVKYSCRWQPKRRCLLMAGSGHRPGFSNFLSATTD